MQHISASVVKIFSLKFVHLHLQLVKSLMSRRENVTQPIL